LQSILESSSFERSDRPETSTKSYVENQPVGSFAEAAGFPLVALGKSYADGLRDLEAMWDFNDMIEERNPTYDELRSCCAHGACPRCDRLAPAFP
jgi:hypothetical protein